MNADTENKIDYEKLSYGKLGYKRIQRLRKKGKRRGIEVPPLGFELTKPEKPRVAFWIAAIAGIVLLVGIMIGAGFLIKFLIDLFEGIFEDTGGLFKTLTDPTVVFGSQGFSFIPLLLLIVAYLSVALIAVVPILMLIYSFRFVRYMLYTARCSKEEFAKGGIITGHITAYVGILVAATILLIVVLSFTEAQTAKLLVGLIYGGIVIIFGGLLLLMTAEKKKCGKWFQSLDEEKKQNYLAHEKALRRVKSRLNFEKNLWNDMFK